MTCFYHCVICLRRSHLLFHHAIECNVIQSFPWYEEWEDPCCFRIIIVVVFNIKIAAIVRDENDIMIV
jgi:hypothetical protein